MKKSICSLLTVMLALVLLLACSLPAFAQQVMTRGQVAELLLEKAADYQPGLTPEQIIKGDANGDLRYDDPCGRAEALTMLSRAFGELPAPMGNNARIGYPASNFVDLPQWAKTELEDIFAAGIVAGTSAITFSPYQQVTDLQMFIFLQRTYAYLGTDLKDDYYAAVNKEDLDSSEIAAGYSSDSTTSRMKQTTDSQLSTLIRETVKNPKTAADKKIVGLYRSILDWDSRNQQGIEPIRDYIQRADHAQTLAELIDLQNDVMAETGLRTLCAYDLNVRADDSSRYDLEFYLYQTFLSQGSYQSASIAKKNACLNYITEILKLMGEDENTAARNALQIWTVESNIDAHSLNMQQLYNVELTNNLFTPAQLQAILPGVDLDAVLAAFGMQPAEQIVVLDVGKLKTTAAYYTDANVNILRELLKFNIGRKLGVYLSRDFVDAENAYKLAYQGIAARDDESYAQQQIMSTLADYLGQSYVKRYMNPRAKADVEKMTTDIIAIYEQRILALDWMSEATKEKAVEKLQAITLNIGYPDQWPDTYDEISFTDTYYENMAAAGRAKQAALAERQLKPVDKKRWLMNAYTVNAYYWPYANSINFPAGILQAPMYDVNASYEENLGGIGFVIAHEITHAFDNNGSKYDKDGNHADWWTEEEHAAFEQLCTKVVKLYDGAEYAPGLACNGALTLSENIADLGAAACVTQLEGQRKNPDYATLYNAMARSWFGSYSRAYLEYLQSTNVHAADKLRVNIPLQNFPEFYEAFGITADDAMWLPEEERVVIW